MVPHRRHIILLLSFLLLLPAGMQAETSARLRRMMAQLPCLPAPTDTFFMCPQLGAGQRLVIERDGRGEVTHLGLSVFTPEVKRLSNPYLCNCVERLLLECLLQSDEAARLNLLREERFQLLLNGYPLGHANFRRFADCLPLFAPSSTMTFEEYGNSYSLKVDAAGDNAFTMAFPKDRELIFGTDKKEEDEAVGRRLELGGGARLTPRIPDVGDLQAAGAQGLWRLPGKAFLIDSLRSDLYFRCDGGRAVPVYDAAYPAQSLVNLLMGQIADRDVHLDLSHRRYGLQTPRYRLTMAQLLATVREEDSQCYAVGKLIKGGAEASGVLVIYNPRFQYLNMVTMTVPVEHLFRADAVLNAYLFTNVPQHNVLELFEERLKK